MSGYISLKNEIGEDEIIRPALRRCPRCKCVNIFNDKIVVTCNNGECKHVFCIVCLGHLDIHHALFRKLYSDISSPPRKEMCPLEASYRCSESFAFKASEGNTESEYKACMRRCILNMVFTPVISGLVSALIFMLMIPVSSWFGIGIDILVLKYATYLIFIGFVVVVSYMYQKILRRMHSVSRLYDKVVRKDFMMFLEKMNGTHNV